MVLVPCVCLSVCLSVGKLKKLWTDFDEISWNGRAWPRDQRVQFWWRSGSLSRSRSPKSGFTGLSNYQRILIKFYGELGCGLEINWLHFGDEPHHYPNLGVRSGSRSRSGKNWHNSVMLAFGGGLCSL